MSSDTLAKNPSRALAPVAVALQVVDHPHRLQLFVEAGYLWLYLGDTAEAALAFAGAAALAPNDPTPLLGLAETELTAGRATEALALLERALAAPHADAPRKGLAHLLQARAHERLANTGATQAALQAAAAIDPDGPAGQAARLRREVGAAATPTG